VAVARRVAPYVTQMHAKDCIVFFGPNGLRRQIKPCGEGIVDFPAIFDILRGNGHDIHAQIEDHKSIMEINLFDPAWNAHHPDMQLDEVLHLFKLARQVERDVEAGGRPDIMAYEAVPFSRQRRQRTDRAVAYLSQFK
jgi:sugar phosphate isomerase/epimerase